MTTSLNNAFLYGILDFGYVSPETCEAAARKLLEGGVALLQFRAKDIPPRDQIPLAEKILPLCREFHVPLIINDHPEVARAIGADGLHVGQDDMNIAQARKISGARIVGLSTHSLDQVRASRERNVDYIGFGPLFATPTKPGAAPIGVREIAEAHRIARVPVYCIGGIKPDNLSSVLASGARRVVIVSGLLQAQDIVAACKRCVDTLKNAVSPMA